MLFDIVILNISHEKLLLKNIKEKKEENTFLKID